MLTNAAYQLLLVDLTEQVDLLASNLRQVRETVDQLRQDDRPAPGIYEDSLMIFLPIFHEGE